MFYLKRTPSFIVNAQRCLHTSQLCFSILMTTRQRVHDATESLLRLKTAQENALKPENELNVSELAALVPSAHSGGLPQITMRCTLKCLHFSDEHFGELKPDRAFIGYICIFMQCFHCRS